MQHIDIEKAIEIKNIIENYPDTQVSIILDNELVIQNSKTDAMYKVKYYFNENDIFVLDTTNAQLIRDKQKRISALEEFKINCNNLRNTIKMIFDDYDNIIHLKKLITELPSIQFNSLNSVIQEEKNNENINNTKIIKLFKQKIDQYEKIEQEFQKQLHIFDENGDLIAGEFYDLNIIKQCLNELSKLYEQYKENALMFDKAYNEILEILGDEEITNKFFENFDYDNVNLSISKNLVNLNKKYNFDINIPETTKKLIQIFEIYGVSDLVKNSGDGAITGAPNPVIVNLAQDNKFRPRFFRFKMGIFTPEDVKTMLNEINFCIQSFGDLTDEDLEILSNYKKILNYMLQSGQINDHLLIELIKEFNAKYAKDHSDEYNDISKQLDWKSREQQREGLVRGFAISSNSIA